MMNSEPKYVNCPKCNGRGSFPVGQGPYERGCARCNSRGVVYAENLASLPKIWPNNDEVSRWKNENQETEKE